MIQISNKQMEQFKDPSDCDMHALVREHLQREHPELIQDIDPISLDEMVDLCIHRAKSVHFRTLESYFLLSGCMFEFSPTFLDYPKIKEALDQAQNGSDAAFEAILGNLSEKELAEIESCRNYADWFALAD